MMRRVTSEMILRIILLLPLILVPQLQNILNIQNVLILVCLTK